MARHEQERRDRAYRIYVTDSLKVIGSLNVRYADIIRKDPAPTETAEEIIDRLSRGLDDLGDNGGDG